MSAEQEGPAESLRSHIRDSLDSLSSSERKIARVILANYPIAGLETVAELARRSQVSPPTVVRFATKLGFSGYPAFQKRLMREIHERLGSPLEQYSREDLLDSDSYLSRASATFVRGIQETFRELPQGEFDAAVALLVDPRRTVRLMGGRFSQMLATYLGQHLRLLRSGVEIVTPGEMGRLATIADVSRTDITVVFDYRRYDADTVRFAQRVADRGSDIILFTDRWLSPVADVARVALPMSVDAPSPFDSQVPALAVIETVIAGVTAHLGEQGRTRLETIEAMRPRAAVATWAANGEDDPFGAPGR